MDPAAKKRKADADLAAAAFADPTSLLPLSSDDAAAILAPFTADQLLSIVSAALARPDPAVLADVRAVADRDPAQRKLFIRGLGWDTTADSLRSVFSAYGPLEEAVIINDKSTGRSKGYGFITFRHIDGAIRALKDPSKQIDGRITVTNLASQGATGGGAATGGPGPIATGQVTDSSQRKIFVGNVPADMSTTHLLSHFVTYGEVEEGPLGFDKQTGKFRGYALFVYKTVEGAQAALVEPNKVVDGVNLVCRLANADSKKMGKVGAMPVAAAPVVPQVQPSDVGQSVLPGQYGIPSGPFGGYTGGAGLPNLTNHANPSPYGVAGQGLSSVGGQVPSSLGGLGAGGYGGGFGGPYGPTSQYGSQGAAGGYGGFVGGSSLYRLPPGLGGLPSVAHAHGENGQYPLPSSAYQSHHLQPAPAGSPGRRYPTGGVAYPGLPPYF